MVRISPKFKSMSLTCAMKMAARASYRAVPSMFMVAPTGSTKRVIRLSTWLFSSRHLKVMGRVAELRRDKFCHHSLIIIMFQNRKSRRKENVDATLSVASHGGMSSSNKHHKNNPYWEHIQTACSGLLKYESYSFLGKLTFLNMLWNSHASANAK